MPTITTRALRGSAVAVIGVLALAGCSGGDGGGDGTLCTAEQLGSLTEVAVPEDAFENATAEFQPAGAIGDLPTECLLTVEEAGQSVSFAFLTGGEETLATIAEQSNEAGGEIEAVGGVITGSLDGASISGATLAQIAPDTTAFEDPADIVFVTATPSAG